MKLKMNIKIWVIICLVVVIIAITFIPKEYFKPIITGKVVTKVVVVSRVGMNCSIYMFKGWNLVSMPCINATNDRNFMLTTINYSYRSIHTYEIADLNDPWKSYNPSLPSWVVQDLFNITEKNGYWIDMKQDEIWNVNGKIIWPILIDMYEGWNLVGFHSNITMRMNESLATIEGSYSAVYQYDANHSQWLVYYPDLPPWVEQNLTNMSLFYGYWINMTQNDTWVLGS